MLLPFSLKNEVNEYHYPIKCYSRSHSKIKLMNIITHIMLIPCSRLSGHNQPRLMEAVPLSLFLKPFKMSHFIDIKWRFSQSRCSFLCEDNHKINHMNIYPIIHFYSTRIHIIHGRSFRRSMIKWFFMRTTTRVTELWNNKDDKIDKHVKKKP